MTDNFDLVARVHGLRCAGIGGGAVVTVQAVLDLFH